MRLEPLRWPIERYGPLSHREEYGDPESDGCERPRAKLVNKEKCFRWFRGQHINLGVTALRCLTFTANRARRSCARRFPPWG